MNESYPNCPKCGGEWTGDDYYSCTKCGLRFIEDKNNKTLFPSRIVWLSIFHGKDGLYWELDNHSCRYLTGTYYEHWISATILPWLSFDITKEKLKTLLLFT
jgi:hypothetical protein